MTKDFVLDCKMYLQANDRIYDTDWKKILYVLSYMKGGTAGPWKKSWYGENSDHPGTFTTFMTTIEEAFSTPDEAGDARQTLKTLRMSGNMTADDYIAEFKSAASESKITESKALVEYFMEGIPPSLMQKILTMDNPPTTIKGWYEKASIFDTQYRRAKAIVARAKGNSGRTTGGNNGKKYNFQRNNPKYVPNNSRDPNAMDIDRLTIQERDEHMKRGLCFECHKFGHRASDHKAGGSIPQTQRKEEQKTPMKGKDAYMKIRALMAELDEEEKEIALKNMEDEGF